MPQQVEATQKRKQTSDLGDESRIGSHLFSLLLVLESRSVFSVWPGGFPFDLVFQPVK